MMIRLELNDDEAGILCDALRLKLTEVNRRHRIKPDPASDYVADLCAEILSRMKEQCEAESTQA